MSNTPIQNARIIDEAIKRSKLIIANKGVTVPSVCPVEDIPQLIEDIPSGDNTQFIGLIERTATSINIPQGTTSIGVYAFSYYNRLQSVTIPNSVTSIGTNAFRDSRNLASVSIENGVTSIGGLAFYYCTSLTSVTIPNSVTSIGAEAFHYCTNLTTITISNSVTSIGAETFSQCTSLTSVTIPNSVTSIASNAFYYCRSLTTITIPNSVTSIASNAFNNCRSLTNVTIENGFNAQGLDLGASTLYAADTIVSWLNALADRTGQTAYTLTIGSTNRNKLTAEQIAIATNKNWNLA